MLRCLPEAEIIHFSSHLRTDATDAAGILLTPDSLEASAALLGDASAIEKNGGGVGGGGGENESQLKRQNQDTAVTSIAADLPSARADALLRSRALLTSKEICELRLSASVVVLSFGHSAFDGESPTTGEALERQRRLEEVVDAFLTAGAKSVVVSTFPR